MAWWHQDSDLRFRRHDHTDNTKCRQGRQALGELALLVGFEPDTVNVGKKYRCMRNTLNSKAQGKMATGESFSLGSSIDSS